MEVIYLNDNLTTNLQTSCIALGFFDGMHLGHLKLIEKVKQVSNEQGLKKALLTFDLQPKSYLSNQPFRYLMSLDDKIAFLNHCDFDYLFIINFNQSVAKIAPEAFIDNYIINNNIKHVVCGFDFHFGYLGKGDANLLISKQKNNYGLSVVEKLEYQNHKISSSLIRSLLNEGKIEQANHLLNRPYQVTGKIIHGRKNGHKIGFPTINVASGDYVLPLNGVYGSKVIIDNQEYLSMANIGYNPTFTALKQVSLEVNIFNFNQDVYGKVATVKFLKRIRPEQRFSSITKLIEQLQHDRQQIIDELGSSL